MPDVAVKLNLRFKMPKRILAADRWRHELPYVRMITPTREVLLNREYYPIWEHPIGGRVRRARPDEWIAGPVLEQTYVYHDGNTPRRDPNTRARCERILAAWGVNEVSS